MALSPTACYSNLPELLVTCRALPSVRGSTTALQALYHGVITVWRCLADARQLVVLQPNAEPAGQPSAVTAAAPEYAGLQQLQEVRGPAGEVAGPLGEDLEHALQRPTQAVAADLTASTGSSQFQAQRTEVEEGTEAALQETGPGSAAADQSGVAEAHAAPALHQPQQGSALEQPPGSSTQQGLGWFKDEEEEMRAAVWRKRQWPHGSEAKPRRNPQSAAATIR